MQYKDLVSGTAYAVHDRNEEAGVHAQHVVRGVFTGRKISVNIERKSDYGTKQVTVPVFRVEVPRDKTRPVIALQAEKAKAQQAFDAGLVKLNRTLRSMGLGILMDNARTSWYPKTLTYRPSAEGEVVYNVQSILAQGYEWNDKNERVNYGLWHLTADSWVSFVGNVEDEEIARSTVAQLLIGHALDGHIPARTEAVDGLNMFDPALIEAVDEMLAAARVLRGYPARLDSLLDDALVNSWRWPAHFVSASDSAIYVWTEARYVTNTWRQVQDYREQRAREQAERERREREAQARKAKAMAALTALGFKDTERYHSGDAENLPNRINLTTGYGGVDSDLTFWIVDHLLPRASNGHGPEAAETLSATLDVVIDLGERVAALEAQVAAERAQNAVLSAVVDHVDKGREHLLGIRDNLCDTVARLTDEVERLQAEADEEPVTITIKVAGGKVVVA